MYEERNVEDAACLVLLRQIAAVADATVKLEPPEAATALNTLAEAYAVLVAPRPVEGIHRPVKPRRARRP